MTWQPFARLLARFKTWSPWPQDKLESVGAYLEHKGKHVSQEDSDLLAAWLINRYPPRDVIRTQADYLKAVERMGLRARENLANQQPWIPPVEEKDIPVPDAKLAHTYAAYSHIGIPPEYLLHVENTWRLLEAGRRNGCLEAEGIGAYNETCRIAKTRVIGKRYRVMDLLSAYNKPMGEIPVLPHPLCENLNPPNEESVGYCRCCWQILPNDIPGVDPEFKAWLDEEIRKSRAAGT